MMMAQKPLKTFQSRYSTIPACLFAFLICEV